MAFANLITLGTNEFEGKPYSRHDSVNDVEMTRIYQKNQ